MEDGLTNEQTEKVIQFQDLTGIEDMSVCRDVLIRHQWDLEVRNNYRVYQSRSTHTKIQSSLSKKNSLVMLKLIEIIN